ncbi:hypothetical protein OIU84_021056 [Salix udensis]|uniref:Uncharacterized protein n=1 Tax=Salix udensis TaxID=889485 RepID=A0AAD6KU27_9ROSI|nr:hypothetical protein OIU84_021056 [Salix udensis]
MLKFLGHMPVLLKKVWTREDGLNGGFSIRHSKKHLQRLLEQDCLSEVQFYWDTRGIHYGEHILMFGD